MPVLTQENTFTASALDFVTTNDWVLIRAGARQMKFAQGEALIVQDSPGGTMYLFRSGSARIVTNGVNVARLGPGQICGEIAFLDNRLSSASVIAEEPIEADAIEWTELNRIFRMFPHVGSRFYQSIAVLLSRRLRDTSSRLADAQMR
jgi:CRP-like cAMP-binding protein